MMKAPENSKFDYGEFRDGYDDFAVNSAKYTLGEALGIYAREMDLAPGEVVAVTTNAFVRHRAGISEDDEPMVCWWLEYEEHKTSCPVYAMHPRWDRDSARGYELHLIPKEDNAHA